MNVKNKLSLMLFLTWNIFSAEDRRIKLLIF